MVDRYGVLVFVAAGLLVMTLPASAGPAAPAAKAAPAPVSREAGPPSLPTGDTGTRDQVDSSAPLVSQDAAARARMHECGHQWSAMKKAGSVGTLTWKDFSATCLVVSK